MYNGSSIFLHASVPECLKTLFRLRRITCMTVLDSPSMFQASAVPKQMQPQNVISNPPMGYDCLLTPSMI